MEKRNLIICLFFMVLIGFMCLGSSLTLGLIKLGVSTLITSDVIMVIIVIVAVIAFILVFFIDKIDNQITEKLVNEMVEEFEETNETQ